MADDRNVVSMTPEEAFLLGKEYHEGKNGKEQSYEKAVEYYTIAANAKYVRAQYELARIYYWGYLGESDIDEAIHWFEEASANGDLEATYMAGVCYEESSGQFCHDYSMLGMAKYYFELAAKKGHKLAQKAYKRYANRDDVYP